MNTFFWQNQKISFSTHFSWKYLFLGTETVLSINNEYIASSKKWFRREITYSLKKHPQEKITLTRQSSFFSFAGKYIVQVGDYKLAQGTDFPRNGYLKSIALLLILLIISLVLKFIFIVPKQNVEYHRTLPLPQQLKEHHKKIGKPRVLEIAPNIFIAMGFEFTNTVLIRTQEGNVVIDTSISPLRAKKVKKALHKLAPGITKAIIFTHSHIDHTGGASEWVESDTEIWATDSFLTHTIKQYGMFNSVESMRGNRQFGLHVSEDLLPCFALGARVPPNEANQTGLRLPNKTFSGRQILHIGEYEIHLIEAHGETHDQLFVWIPHQKILLCGDNFYHAFPNIYTIRGTKPRPVTEWIKSLDLMRTFDCEILIPGHTFPIVGKEKIRETLRNYRDGIQWVRDTVVRYANEGHHIEEIIAKTGLPPHLAKVDALKELYGQIDWSARAIYTNELGWFDGRADKLYPMAFGESQKKEIEMMGGVQKVINTAIDARLNNHFRWSIHLLAKIRDSNILNEEEQRKLRKELSLSYHALGQTIFNTNGRAYLLEMAYELENGREQSHTTINNELLEELPIQLFFENMCYRLIPEKTIDVFDTFVFNITDINKTFFMTIRYGVAELIIDKALPDTPTAKVIITTDSLTWKKLALKKISRAEVLSNGKIQIEGDKIHFVRFSQYFKSDL